MSNRYTRYAVYFVPGGSWGEFGADWLGWNSRKGMTATQPALPGADIAALTERPRKYGFHATIKPPMRLVPEADIDTLTHEVAALCGQLAPVPLPSLTLSRLGRFFALTAPGEVDALRALCSTVVRGLDHFRAPAGEAELDRRRKGGLTASQEANLVTWGYPFVMEDFRFHLTLTGPVAEPDTIEPQIAEAWSRQLGQALVLKSLSLLGEGEGGRFYEIERFTLKG